MHREKNQRRPRPLRGGIALDTLGWILLAVILLIITVILIMNATPLAKRAVETIRTVLAFM